MAANQIPLIMQRLDNSKSPEYCKFWTESLPAGNKQIRSSQDTGAFKNRTRQAANRKTSQSEDNRDREF